MTRCPEYYDKWSKDPNWCNLSPAAVSQINSYLEWVDALEADGVSRKFTMVKLPERVARPLFPIKDGEIKDQVKSDLVKYLKNPNTGKLSGERMRDVIETAEIEVRNVEITKLRSEEEAEEARTGIKNVTQDDLNTALGVAKEPPQVDTEAEYEGWKRELKQNNATITKLQKRNRELEGLIQKYRKDQVPQEPVVHKDPLTLDMKERQLNGLAWIHGKKPVPVSDPVPATVETTTPDTFGVSEKIGTYKVVGQTALKAKIVGSGETVP